MESREIRTRFGRCPYCRAMIYQDPEAVIYYCSKCRTPIRGKNAEPTEETEHALSRLEILSADTASVFSDEIDACPKQASVLDVHGDQQPPLFSNPNSCSNLTANSRGDTLVYSNGHDELRPSSRRTRRSACSDSFVLRYGVFMASHSETEGEFSSSPRSACGRRRRRSLVGLQELETSTAGWSMPAPPPSPLTDPAFQRDLLRSLDDLRGLIAAIEPPASTGARAAAARRGARFFRRLETRLARAVPLPGQAEYPTTHRNAGGGAGSSSSASSTAGGRGERRRHHRCRPVLGGAPFVVCGGCSELLLVPATMVLSRRRLARMLCGGCGEVLEVTAPAGVAAGSAPHQTKTSPTSSSAMPKSDDDPGSCSGSVRAGGAKPLHHALGYSSPSPLLQSRRY